MNNKSIVIFSFIAVSVLLLVCLIFDCFGQKNLKEVAMEGELREYNGEKLSSISAFRENSISGAPDVDLDSYRLEVVNSVGNSKSYKYEEVLGKFTSMKKVVSLYCVEGWSVRVLYEGVLMREILQDVGITENDKIVILHSIDGYTTSLPVEYFLKNDIILAYKINGVTLPKEIGFPFQLVAEDKWGYKWAKWVNKIELGSDVNFRGFWESRGYSNDGDLDKSFLED